MKKIYTKTVFQFNKKTGTFDIDESESQFHLVNDDFKMSQMKGGDDSGSAPAQTITNQNQSGTSSTAPWAFQQPYLKRGFGEIENAFLDNAPYLAEFDPATLNAHGGILNAANDNTLGNNSSEMINRTLRGDYLTGGTGFNAALDAAKNTIIPQVQSAFASRGRTGSGLAQTAEASAIGDKFAGLYENERQNQLRAGQLAPVINEMKYSGFDRMAGVGSERQKLAEFNANARRNNILKYLQSISGNYGGETTSTSTGTSDASVMPAAGGGQSKGWQRYLAGAGGGALAGSAFGPWGAAAGGAIGLLGAM